MTRPQVTERVWRIAEPLTAHKGFEVVDVEYRPERGRMVLRLYVDRSEGVTLDDLSKLSRELGDLLEVREVIDSPYTLEVSSPGINRPLKKPEHFRRYVGQRIRVRTGDLIGGRRNFVGILVTVTEEGVTLRLEDSQEVDIPFAVVTRANYEHDFDVGRRTPAKAGTRRGALSPEAARRT